MNDVESIVQWMDCLWMVVLWMICVGDVAVVERVQVKFEDDLDRLTQLFT